MKSNRENEKDLIALARKFESGLRSGEFRALAQEDEASNDDLTPEELSELKEAKAALYFLNDVRKSIKRKTYSENKQTETDFGNSSVRKSTIVESEKARQEKDGHDRLDQTFQAGDQGLPPEILGRFQIIELIGEGGFAKVFRAHDPRLKRDVALKIPKPQVLMSRGAVSRFRREATSAAVLSHPSIVSVFEAGTLGPITYMASEYFPGDTLAEWFKNQDKSIGHQTAVRIVSQLADAAQHAHQRKVIHRDLKPANILVIDGPEDVSQRLRVTDFGLAKQLDSVESTLTFEGDIIGTPAYMSPEQARADSDIGAASDIYSLGVIFYELLTGQLPCRGKNHFATIRLIEEGNFHRPRKIASNIPRDLEAICLKALAFEEADRYASAQDLRKDLDDWLAGNAVQARKRGPTEKLVRTLTRSHLKATLAVTSLALIIGTTVVAWNWNDSNAQAMIENPIDARSSRALTQFGLRDVLGIDHDRYKDNPNFNELQHQLINETVELQERLLWNDPGNCELKLQTATAILSKGYLHDIAGNYQDALDSTQRVDQIVATLSGDASFLVDRQLVDFHSHMIKMRASSGSFLKSETLELVDSLIAKLKRGIEGLGENENNVFLVSCLERKAAMSVATVDKTKAAQDGISLLDSIRDHEDFVKLKRAELSFQMMVASEIRRARGDFKVYFEQTRNLVEKLLHDNPKSAFPRYLSSRIKVLHAEQLFSSGKSSLAIDTYRESQQIASDLKNELQPFGMYADWYFKTTAGLTQALVKLNESESEINGLRREMSQALQKLDPNIVLTDRSNQLLSLSIAKLGAFVSRIGTEDPEPYCKTSLDMCLRLHENKPSPQIHRNLVMCYGISAQAMNNVGRRDKSLEFAETGIRELNRLLSASPKILEHPRITEMYSHLIRQHVLNRDFESAEKATDKLTKQLMSILDEDSSWTCRIAFGETARCYLEGLNAVDELIEQEVDEKVRETLIAKRKQWVKRVAENYELAAGHSLDWTKGLIKVHLKEHFKDQKEDADVEKSLQSILSR